MLREILIGKKMDKEKKLRPISEELVEKILKEESNNASLASKSAACNHRVSCL